MVDMKKCKSTNQGINIMDNDQKKQVFSGLMHSRASKFKADVMSGKYLLPEELGEPAPYFNQKVDFQLGDKVKGKAGTGYPEIVVADVQKDRSGIVVFSGKETCWYRQEDFEVVQ